MLAQLQTCAFGLGPFAHAQKHPIYTFSITGLCWWPTESPKIHMIIKSKPVGWLARYISMMTHFFSHQKNSFSDTNTCVRYFFGSHHTDQLLMIALLLIEYFGVFLLSLWRAREIIVTMARNKLDLCASWGRPNNRVMDWLVTKKSAIWVTRELWKLKSTKELNKRKRKLFFGFLSDKRTKGWRNWLALIWDLQCFVWVFVRRCSYIRKKKNSSNGKFLEIKISC